MDSPLRPRLRRRASDESATWWSSEITNRGTTSVPPRKPVLATAVAGLLLVTAGCSGAGSTGGGSGDAADNTITALMVGNPQMEDIQKLTADNFTKQTGITVKFTILPENELRDKVTQDVANQGGQYDVATVGAYEVPIWAKNGWLLPLDNLGIQLRRDRSSHRPTSLRHRTEDRAAPLITSASHSTEQY